MTTTIEREIVQMVFDAKQFRKGIQNSIKDLSDFKKSFNFGRAHQSFAELESSSEMDFSVMAGGIESVNAKMIAMGTIAAQVITSIATSIMDAGRGMVDALFMDPITSGLAEYEIQLNAVQTILANTAKAGTDLDDVTAALDELNTYADLTIYNFTEMVDSIGKFTTAGVDLETSVAAIKGIANVAAISGANSQQAATAMYQLSQAISSGTVRLQDWISVENAGMGGVLFQDSLIETARLHGIAIDDMIKKNGSFRFSLQEGWLSSEIMLETLEKYTGDLTDAQLLSLGYTQEQVVAIQETAQLALDAATKVKTFTALKDTMAEALGSGWSQSWALILGDFEEAKVLWGAVAEFFGDIIQDSSDARNALLEGWKMFGGRTIMIEGFFNIFEAGKNIMSTVGEAFRDIFGSFTSVDLLRITIAFRDFTEKLKMASERGQKLKNFLRGLFAIFDIGFMIIKAIVKPIAAFVKALLPGGGAIMDMASGLGMAIFYFREFAIESGIFDIIVSNIIAGAKKLIGQAKELVKAFLKLDVVGKVVEWFGLLSDFFKRVDWVRTWEEVLNVLRYALAPFYLLALGAQWLYKEIDRLQIIQKVVEWFQAIDWQALAQHFINISDGVKELVNNFKESEVIEKFVTLIKTFDGRRITQFVEDAKTAFKELGGVIGGIRGIFGVAGDGSNFIVDKLKDIGSGIITGIKAILDYLINNAENINYSQLFDIINKALFGGLLLALKNFIQGGLIGGILGDDLTEGVEDIFETMEGTLSSFQNNIRADTLQKIAIAIAVLAGSIFLMTLIDSGKLTMATTAIVVMLTALFGSAGAMKLINAKDAIKASITIVGLAVAIAIAALALRLVSGINPVEMTKSLKAMGIGLAALVLSVKGLSSGGTGGLVKTVGLLLGLSIALLLLSTAIRTYGNMDPEVLTQGLLGITAALAALTGSAAIIGKSGGKNMISASVGITIMAAALLLLQKSVVAFGEMDLEVLAQGMASMGLVLVAISVFSKTLDKSNMLKAGAGIALMAKGFKTMASAIADFAELSWEELARGLVGLGAVLLGTSLAANAMSGALPGAVATLVMAGAIVVMAGALHLLAELSWEELLIGLAAIAGVFIVLGLAGLILTPVVPTLIALGIAMLLIGAGAALFGLGISLAAGGLVLLAGSSILVAKGIEIVGGAIIEVLPKLAEAVAEALVSFLTTVAEKTPELIEAMHTIILGMITAVAELIPDIVVVILEMITAILEAIGEALPDLIQAGYDILLAFLNGIADNIAEVVATGLRVLTEFMVGLEEGIPALVDQAFSTILTFLNAVADAVEEYMPQIVEAGLRIGEGIVDGLVDAILGGLGVVKDAVIRIAKAALDALGLGFLWSSPSKKTYEIGEGFVQGFVNAVLDGIRQTRSAMAEFAEAAQDGVKPLIDAIASDIDKGLDFSPVITPVLDLDNISSGVMALNKSFNNSRVLAELSYSGRLTSGEDSVVGANGSDGGVTFIQHNHSPKALDRETIYRQTRTQVAKLSNKVFE